jgi:ligand-binding sensor domain-containing protein
MVKSFTCFKDGLINPWIWTILEDKTGNLWVGTRETGLYLFDGKTFINYSEYKQIASNGLTNKNCNTRHKFKEGTNH